MRKNRELKVDFPKKSKVEKILPIIALLVAIFGGVPGIFVITNYFYTNRVVFGFNPEGIVGGSFQQKKMQYIMLLGTVTNEGNKPLHPAYFDLKVKIKDKWISLQKWTIPEDDFFNKAENKTQNIKIKKECCEGRPSGMEATYNCRRTCSW